MFATEVRTKRNEAAAAAAAKAGSKQARLRSNEETRREPSLGRLSKQGPANANLLAGYNEPGRSIERMGRFVADKRKIADSKRIIADSERRVEEIEDAERAREEAEQEQCFMLVRKRIYLFIHCDRCLAEKGTCTVSKGCTDGKVFLHHARRCRDPGCPVPACSYVQSILAHCKKCKDSSCILCSPVRKMVAKPDAKSNSSSEAVTAPTPSLSGLQRHLLQLLHAFCACAETPSDDKLLSILVHTSQCEDEDCKEDDCYFNSFLLGHFIFCKIRDCDFCSPIRDEIQKAECNCVDAAAKLYEEKKQKQRQRIEALMNKAKKTRPSQLKRKLRNMGVDVSGLVEKSDLVDAYVEAVRKRETPALRSEDDENAENGTTTTEDSSKPKAALVDPYSDMPRLVPSECISNCGIWSDSEDDENDEVTNLHCVFLHTSGEDACALHVAAIPRFFSSIYSFDGNLWIVSSALTSSESNAQWDIALATQRGHTLELYRVSDFDFGNAFTIEVDGHNGIWGLFPKAVDSSELVLACVNYRYPTGEVIEDGFRSSEEEGPLLVGSSIGGIFLYVDEDSLSASSALTPGIWFVTTGESILVFPIAQGGRRERVNGIFSANRGKGIWLLVASDDIKKTKVVLILQEEKEESGEVEEEALKFVTKQMVINLGIESVRTHWDAVSINEKGFYLLHDSSISYVDIEKQDLKPVARIPGRVDSFYGRCDGCVWLMRSGNVVGCIDRNKKIHDCGSDIWGQVKAFY